MKRITILLLLGFVISGCGGKTTSNSPTQKNTTNLLNVLSPKNTSTLVSTNTPTNSLNPASTDTPAQTSISGGLGIGSQQVSLMDDMVMVFVPAGEFKMGREDGDSDEKPIHIVYLDAYWIDKYEVTNAQYAGFLNDLGNQMEGGVNWLEAGDVLVRIEQIGGTWQPMSKYGDHPVVKVSWFGASAYCEWAGRRLPSEAEWEKAARGEDGRTYPWGEGNVKGSLANSNVNTEGTTAVGSFPGGASPYGALDMAGNVMEWAADWYDENYYKDSPKANPMGPTTGTNRTLRGGLRVSDGWRLRSSNRYGDHPDDSERSTGFRCAASP